MTELVTMTFEDMKKWREDIEYDEGHIGYVCRGGRNVYVQVIEKTYYDNGARKGSIVETVGGLAQYRTKWKVRKIFTKEEIMEE